MSSTSPSSPKTAKDPKAAATANPAATSATTDVASFPVQLVGDARSRIESAARDTWNWSTDVAGQVRVQVDQLVQAAREQTAKWNQIGRERAGDVRGRVQPVVEQVQSHTQRVVDVSVERAKSLVARDNATSV